MKKRLFCALAALLLAMTPALAEEETATAAATLAPTPAPTGVPHVQDGLQLLLPAGMVVLEGDALAAYDAAVQADYPDTARTLLAAVNSETGALLTIAEAESGANCLDAAREAAQTLIGDPDAAQAAEYGENRCAAFACAIGEQIFRLYYFSDGEHLRILGASGLTDAELDALLTGLSFR